MQREATPADVVAELAATLATERQPDNLALAHLSVISEIGEWAAAATADTVQDAYAAGASTAQIAQILGVTPRAIEKRFGGHNDVAVVISRGARIYSNPDDPRGRYGEMPTATAAEQYAADRGYWRVGHAVRAKARYAIVAAEGQVKRIYKIDTAQWTHDPDCGKWSFAAVGATTMSDSAIAAAAGKALLPYVPGDTIPIMRGRAYWPLWFTRKK